MLEAKHKLQIAYIVEEVILSLFNPSATVVKLGQVEWKIKNFKNGAVRAVDIGEYRFMTQNPLKDSTWGKMAAQGHKIVWVLHHPSATWLFRVVDGKQTTL